MSAHQPGVIPRDVLLAQPDGVSFLPADRDLVANQRDDNALAFVILDEEFLHGSTGASPETTLVAASAGIKRASTWETRKDVQDGSLAEVEPAQAATAGNTVVVSRG